MAPPDLHGPAGLFFASCVGSGMRKSIASIAALALAACQPAADDELTGVVAEEPAPLADVPVRTPTPETAPPGVARPERQQLLPAGEYRVAGADGADIDLGHGISLSVSEDTIALASQCVTPRWTYRYVDGRLRTEAIGEPICERGLHPAEEAIIAVFHDPQQITRTPANGIYIEGGGHSVTLFSQ
jgi:hypothetical protein